MDKVTASEFDAYAPAEMAVRVENAGVNKATMPFLQTMVLALLAGAFISFGAMFYTVVVTESGLGFGPQRLLGGISFSLGFSLALIFVYNLYIMFRAELAIKKTSAYYMGLDSYEHVSSICYLVYQTAFLVFGSILPPIFLGRHLNNPMIGKAI